MPDVDLAKFASRAWINPPGGVVGPILASASSVTITHPIHHVSGAAALDTLVPPFPGFIGEVTLIPDGAFTTVATGNIGAAATAVVGRAISMVFDGTKWYPR
jgi:hypothetical protein